LAFDKNSGVKEYKEKIEELSKENNKISKKLSKVIIERNWAVEKLRSLGSSKKKKLRPFTRPSTIPCQVTFSSTF